MRTLLTGFGPFGTVVSNPSERVVEAFRNRDIAGHSITTHVFDVSYARASAGMLDLLMGHACAPFDLVLMLGVASNRSWWSVEKGGCNRNGLVPDVEDYVFPERPIRKDGPDWLPATLPVEALVQAIEAVGLPASASDSAGAFLCNHLLYETLFLLQGVPGVTRAGFLHVPPDDQTLRADETVGAPAFTFSAHLMAVEAVLAALVKDDNTA